MVTTAQEIDIKLGVIGLGRLRADASSDSLATLVAKPPTPRWLWVMVPAGQDTVASLLSLLAAGDAVTDGGNSN